MSLNDGELEQLLTGLLPPPYAAELIYRILAPYSISDRREILTALRETLGDDVVDRRRDDQEPSIVRTALLGQLYEIAPSNGPPTVARWELRERLLGASPDSVVAQSGLIRIDADVDDLEFPLFQFAGAEEPEGPLEIRPSVIRVNRVLRARRDPWGALAWWITPNGFLRGQRPAEQVSIRTHAYELEDAVQDLVA